MRIPLLCLVLCLAWANSWSAEAPKDNSKANQQATKADQRGTKNTPFVIEALPSKHTHTKTDDEKKQEQVKAREDSLIAESTFALAVITGFLALFTLGLMIFTYRLWTATVGLVKGTEITARQQAVDMRESLDIANQSANTSKESINLAREEFISTHRPNIRLKHIFLDSDIWKDDGVRIRMAIVNTGVNSAHILEANVAILFLRDDEDLPQVPHFSEATKVGPIDTAMASGQTFVFPKGWVMSADDSLSIGFNSADSADLFLYCFGYVDYADSTRRVNRKTAFCRVMKIPEKGKQITRFKELEEKNTDYEYQD